uniref:FAD/NAD(P)-binding domain-containing protein n=1 Tax=Moniliophthora roreri TaxID=221103 RepID=A0A0W0EY77_MONRR
MLSPKLTIVLSLLTTCLCQQHPFYVPETHSESSSYEFKWPIEKVAVIGAGVGGMLTFREFKRSGFQVTLFERDTLPGGVWHYSDQIPLNAPIPNAPPTSSDYIPDLPPENVELPYEMEVKGLSDKEVSEMRRAHRLPKPVWKSLKSNAPAPDQQIRDWRWPDDTPWELPQEYIGSYLRSFASFNRINTNDGNPNVFYDTRVELIQPRLLSNSTQKGWTLTLKQLIQTSGEGCRVKWWKEDFDAIIVATGRYNAPSMPPIRGLSEWADRFPNAISHSRQYRTPDEEKYRNKTVLIVGAAASGAEIGLELSPVVKALIVSTRPDNATAPHYPLSFYTPRLPANTTQIGEIARFYTLPDAAKGTREGKIELTNGTIISGVDKIIFCTGFRYTYPFLPQYMSREPKDPKQVLVTDGTHIRNLHLDLFFIAEPTIGFVGVNAGTQAFTYTTYLAAALSSVWSGFAKLPSQAEMERMHEERVKVQGGYTKHFLFLGSQAAYDMIRYLVAWINSAALKDPSRKLRQIDTPSPFVNEALTIWSMARFGSSDFNSVEGRSSLWEDEAEKEKEKERALNAMWYDHW